MLLVRYITLFGKEIFYYEIFNIASFFVLLAYMLVVSFKYRDELAPNEKSWWIVIKTSAIAAGGFFPATAINGVFGDWLTEGHANYYGTLCSEPVFILIACILLGTKPIKNTDYLIVGMPLALAVAKIGCHCAGCCYGKRWPFGIYNYSMGEYQYPVQLIESCMALIIAVLLFLYVDLCIEKMHKGKRGTAAPLYIMLYSLTRFFIEFMKAEFPHVLGSLNGYQVQSMAAFLIGTAMFVLMWRYGERIDGFFVVLIEKLRGRLERKKQILK